MSQEQGIKNPRAKALWDKWRHVWMMAWERDRRLKDKLNYLQVYFFSFPYLLGKVLNRVSCSNRSWSA